MAETSIADLIGEARRVHCQVDGCRADRYCRGWCTKHYQRWRRHGDPKHTTTMLGADYEHGFWSRVDVGHPLGCWLWTGFTNDLGYGKVTVNSVTIGAHRLAYTLLKGQIPDGLHLDHLCRTPSCVNPDHLEAVPHKVNNARGVSPSAKNARKSRCKRGHQLTRRNHDGARECKTCKVDLQRARRRKARA